MTQKIPVRSPHNQACWIESRVSGKHDANWFNSPLVQYLKTTEEIDSKAYNWMFLLVVHHLGFLNYISEVQERWQFVAHMLETMHGKRVLMELLKGI